MKVLRNNQNDTLTFKLIREEILLKSLIYYGFYPANSNNVYLKLNNFNKTAGAEIQNAIRKLRNEREINSIILDLRGNPGGLLESAIEVSDKFLQKNLLIVSTRGKDESTERKYFSNEEPLFKDEKVVVLINENSASASEIVAGAIQDHDRGIILGTQSFGKGLVQTITPITNEVSLKITTAKYYTPSGRCIQKIDYFKNNKVVKGLDLDSTSDFFTDNSRKVFSAGGITPDTLVESIFKNSFIEELLAQGLIFEFVDEYSSENNLVNFEKDNEKNIFNKFITFISNKPEKIKIESSKKINEIITQMKKDSLDESYIKELVNFNKKLENYSLNLVEKNRAQILSLIKIELVRRYYDSKKSLEESLKSDYQVATALKLISNDNSYSRILNKTKQN
jgi:carboxyl-terminal processing protease